MANRHFAKLADVWKHLPLAEILAIERPSNYWETHAGNAANAMVDDPERRYGALRFLDVAPAFPALARSRYLSHLRSVNPSPGPVTSYPGSPLLAMLELGAAASYLFCDIDDSSVTDLHAAASSLGLQARSCVVAGDGMTAVTEALDGADGTVLVHIDPFDPRASGPSGLSALELASDLASRGVGLVYWYGYNRPDQRAWPLDTICRGSIGVRGGRPSGAAT